MKNKQILGIVVAGLVFVFVCASGMLSNHLLNKTTESQDNVMKSAFSMFEDADSITLPKEDFVGIIRVEGAISGETASSFMGSSTGYNHDQNMKFVDKMIEADNNKGIMLYIDSPGGTVYHSDEMYLKLLEYKEKTGRPIQAFCATEACSGGYYIAMASDKITANRNAWIGSIGVIIQLTNMKDLYEKIGIKEDNIVSGKNKAMGSAGIDMTEEQREILQELVDEAYDQFVGIVASGRKMDDAKVRELADGRIYSALQCEKNGLIDAVDNYENAKTAFGKELGDESITYYEPGTDDMADMFSSLFSAYENTKEKSDAQILTEYLEKKGNGVLMYYAE